MEADSGLAEPRLRTDGGISDNLIELMNFNPKATKKKSHLSGVPLNRSFLNKLFKLMEKDAAHTAHALVRSS